uniref:Uncharacterized protein n=1 Tax=Cacopsylla melanoneura TaxID=428564 RepID=A0A8D8VQ11_9HEMI
MTLISLCVYQLVAASSELSPMRYIKLLASFVGIMCEFYLICNSSEEADDCNMLLANAVKYSSWEKCNYRTRRDLRMMLRRVQCPNHLRFNQGLVVLSRVYFLKIVKVAYSFVNFMSSQAAMK